MHGGVDRPAASMSHHDDQRRIQMLHRIFHTAKTVIAHQVSGISNDKQFSQTGVKNMLWRHSGISACEDHRTGFLALFRHTAPQALCNRGRIGLSVPIATVAANQPGPAPAVPVLQAYGHCQRRSRPPNCRICSYLSCMKFLSGVLYTGKSFNFHKEIYQCYLFYHIPCGFSSIFPLNSCHESPGFALQIGKGRVAKPHARNHAAS